MRPIKFRGKRLDNGEWVVGDLVTVKNHPFGLKAYIATEGDTKLFYPGCRFIEVNPATVGQFTGLNDEDGREIYEGDVVDFYYEETFSNGRVKGLVVWVCNSWFLECDSVSIPIIGMDWSLAESTLIGNIHNHPELLEER